MNEIIFDFYSKAQYGGDMPYFSGERYNQIGGGFLGNVGRFLLPILKTVGKKLLGIGAETLHKVVNEQKPVSEALINSTHNNFDLKRRRKVINNYNDQFTKAHL